MSSSSPAVPVPSDADPADSMQQRGVLAFRQGRFAEAIEHMRLAAAQAPSSARLHANLCEMLRQIGRPRDALEAGRRSVAIDPLFAPAWSNLGAAHWDLAEFDEALAAHRRAIEIDPGNALAHCSLGNAFYGLRRPEAATQAYRAAIALDPSSADAWANLGTALHHCGDYAEAAQCLRRALALNPEHANAHSGLGLLLLKRGEFAEGWSEYEWRLRSSERRGPGPPLKPWRDESLAGRHIHVQAEQGLGDTLQFARYLPWIARRAGRVSLRVQPELVTLLRESLPGVDVLGDRADVGPFDFEVPLMSLPHRFSTRLETIPAAVPYLRAPRPTIERWRDRFKTSRGLRVGLVWGGNPRHSNDHRRSIDPGCLAPLLEVPGVAFVSLQTGSRAAELAKLGPRAECVLDVSRELGDFSDTAGAVENLDLVISVDSSVAHLAGALGKPLWLLTSWVSDWRWLDRREDALWYPTARLFRQAQGEDWSAVAARVSDPLRRAAAGDTSVLTPFAAAGFARAARAEAILEILTRRHEAPRPAAGTPSPGFRLAAAERRRRDGRLGEAEALCRELLVDDPDNADALHSLALISHQSGRRDEAITHLARAVALAPANARFHANLGEMLRLAGAPEQAIAEARHALAIEPSYADAESNLGIALFDLGRYDEALVHLDRALALNESFALAHSNRGNALQRLKRHAEAEAAYRRALQLDPNFPDAWNNLGTCLRELKQPGPAEQAYRRAIALKPNAADLLDNLGLALADFERFDEAATAFRQAISIAPRDASIYIHWANVQLERREFAEAAVQVATALRLAPGDPDALNQLGRIAFEKGDLTGALAHFEQALAAKPDQADVHNHIGNVLKQLGRLDEAREAYRRALQHDPEAVSACFNLADSITFAPDEPLLARMEALAGRREALSASARLQLDFALGKAYADLGETDRAFERLSAANAAKRARIDYDEAAALGLFDRIERAFPRALFERLAGAGHASDRPIFILGMPRSGTTLMEQILASHPQVHGADELTTLNDVVGEIEAAGTPYPEFARSLDENMLRRIGERYLQRLGELAPESARVTDKMPSNYYFIGLIRLALPNARIVHCRRDPVDVCFSCYSKLFAADQPHTYDLGELGRYYRRYAKLMQHWRSVLPPGSMIEVDYEAVVDDLEATARRVLAYCDLPWDASCLRFHLTDRPVRTASATQVRQPLHRRALGRGRPYARHLAPLLAALGED